MDSGFCYEAEDQSIEVIEWDDLDNSFVANDGTCYKTLEDIPEEFKDLVQPTPEIKPLKVRRVQKKALKDMIPL